MNTGTASDAQAQGITHLVYTGRRLSTKDTLLHVYRDLADLEGRDHAFKKSLTGHAIIGWAVPVDDNGTGVRILGDQVQVTADMGAPTLADTIAKLRPQWAAAEAADLTDHARRQDVKRARADAQSLDGLTLAELRSMYAERRTRAARAALVATVTEYMRG